LSEWRGSVIFHMEERGYSSHGRNASTLPYFITGPEVLGKKTSILVWTSL
jgi:hypothetical protein